MISTSDIANKIELFEEIKLFCPRTKSNSSLKKSLEYINNHSLQKIYPPIITISLKIILTVVSAERSFSKFKLVKMHLRSTISNDRLIGL